MIATEPKRPVNHQRRQPKPIRPPRRQGRTSVTIAAGIRYDNGILLCADREVTEGVSKFSESKVFGERISADVSLAFTLAGAMDYAEMTIQEITAVVKSSRMSSHAEIWGAIKDTLHSTYSDSIGILPEIQQPESQFSLLIAVWAEGFLKLYGTENMAVKEVSQFRCIGIGKELAKYLLTEGGTVATTQMPLDAAEIVSLRILKHVKECVSGCGKETDILILDSSGTITRNTESRYYFELKMIELYDDVTSLLYPLVNLEMTQREREVSIHVAIDAYFRRLRAIQVEKEEREREESETED